MHDARDGLGEHGDLRIEIAGRVALARRGDHETGEPARVGDTQRPHGGTELGPGPAALRAVPAGHHVVERDKIPGRQPGDIRADPGHHAGDLVPGRQRVDRPELTRVQVNVGAADPGRGDAQQHLSGAGTGSGTSA